MPHSYKKWLRIFAKQLNLKKIKNGHFSFFVWHFASTTYCNFKFWKIGPPYCTAFKLHIFGYSKRLCPVAQPLQAAHILGFTTPQPGCTAFISCILLRIQEAADRKRSLQKLLIIEDSRGCIPETQSSEAAHYLGFKTLLAGNTVFRSCSLIQDAADRLHTAQCSCALCSLRKLHYWGFKTPVTGYTLYSFQKLLFLEIQRFKRLLTCCPASRSSFIFLNFLLALESCKLFNYHSHQGLKLSYITV